MVCGVGQSDEAVDGMAGSRNEVRWLSTLRQRRRKCEFEMHRRQLVIMPYNPVLSTGQVTKADSDFQASRIDPIMVIERPTKLN
jgi:hypothetical protein